MADAVADTYLKRPGFEHQEDPSAITIMFVNGVLANETDTQADSDALNRSLKLSGLPQLKYNFTYVANPTDGWINDPSEVLRQADISNLFLAKGTY